MSGPSVGTLSLLEWEHQTHCNYKRSLDSQVELHYYGWVAAKTFGLIGGVILVIIRPYINWGIA